jgi:hypothetical protein
MEATYFSEKFVPTHKLQCYVTIQKKTALLYEQSPPSEIMYTLIEYTIYLEVGRKQNNLKF